MQKIVSNGDRDCTVILDGTECEVKFDRNYRAFAVENNSSGDVIISVKQGAAAGDDGTRRVKSGHSTVFAHMRVDVDTVYVTGTGSVHIHAQNDDVNPFRNAPVSSGGGVTNFKWSLYGAYGMIKNVKTQTGTNGCAYNLNGLIANRLCLFQSFSDYNVTHTNAVDFTNVKKIIVTGATTANTAGLSTTAYCRISDTALTELTDDWTVINQSTGTNVSEFTYEIDCTDITGEQYIHFAVEHGTETSSMSSYFYIDSIEFIYG